MFKYETIEELVTAAEKAGTKISELVIEDQAKAMEKVRMEVYEKMELSFQVMRDSVKTGMDKNLKSTSGLTGGEGYLMNDYSKEKESLCGEFMTKAIARALAAAT